MMMAIAFWASVAAGQAAPDGVNRKWTGTCGIESGIVVCRYGQWGASTTTIVSDSGKAAPAAAAEKPGRLLFLLDIPSNIFARLAADPESNRKFHKRTSWEYTARPGPPPGAGDYAPLPPVDGPVWKYRPKATFAYQPKQDWTYNRDVYGRLWRQNIRHDTRVVEQAIDQPGLYLVPVGRVR